MVAGQDSELLIRTLAREIGQFEEKVSGLEGKCREVRRCIAGLAEELAAARSSFSQTPPIENPTDKDISLAEAAELCGMKDHVDIVRQEPGDSVDLVIHEPGGEAILVDGRLFGGRPCDADLYEALRRIPAHEAGHGGRGLTMVYVPRELTRADCQGLSEHGITVAPPSVLFSLLRATALRWLRFTCGQNARGLVDRGQDLVDDLSAFISDFTEKEKYLCAFVQDCNQASRLLEELSTSLSG